MSMPLDWLSAHPASRREIDPGREPELPSQIRRSRPVRRRFVDSQGTSTTQPTVHGRSRCQEDAKPAGTTQRCRNVDTWCGAHQPHQRAYLSRCPSSLGPLSGCVSLQALRPLPPSRPSGRLGPPAVRSGSGCGCLVWPSVSSLVRPFCPRLWPVPAVLSLPPQLKRRHREAQGRPGRPKPGRPDGTDPVLSFPPVS